MKPKICKGTKNDFAFYVSMALQDRMPWNVLAMLLSNVAPTLNETKEIISLLLKELERLHLAFQDKQEQLKKCQDQCEILVKSTSLVTNVTDTNDRNSFPWSENIVDNDKVTERIKRPKERSNNEMSFDLNEDIQRSEESEVIEEVEIIDDEPQDANGINKKTQEIDNEWYTFISNDKQTDPKTFEYQSEHQGLDNESKSSNMTELYRYEKDEYDTSKMNTDNSLNEKNLFNRDEEKTFREIDNEWYTFVYKCQE